MRMQGTGYDEETYRRAPVEERQSYSEAEREETRAACRAAMNKGWDWRALQAHENKHVRKAARANLAHGRQSVTNKRSVGIGTFANYTGSASKVVIPARGVPVSGTGKPVGA